MKAYSSAVDGVLFVCSLMLAIFYCFSSKVEAGYSKTYTTTRPQYQKAISRKVIQEHFNMLVQWQASAWPTTDFLQNGASARLIPQFIAIWWVYHTTFTVHSRFQQMSRTTRNVEYQPFYNLVFILHFLFISSRPIFQMNYFFFINSCVFCCTTVMLTWHATSWVMSGLWTRYMPQ